MFQHTAARRRLGFCLALGLFCFLFQHTAARRRLVCLIISWIHGYSVSTHSRPKAAGFVGCFGFGKKSKVSTHSRPKAAGGAPSEDVSAVSGFNTQPPEGGWVFRFLEPDMHILFQHTAARRRLAQPGRFPSPAVNGFNTQPPEGGWLQQRPLRVAFSKFQHTAARRRLAQPFI